MGLTLKKITNKNNIQWNPYRLLQCNLFTMDIRIRDHESVTASNYTMLIQHKKRTTLLIVYTLLKLSLVHLLLSVFVGGNDATPAWIKLLFQHVASFLRWACSIPHLKLHNYDSFLASVFLWKDVIWDPQIQMYTSPGFTKTVKASLS